MKLHLVGAKLFHAESLMDVRTGEPDGRTDRHDEVSSHFSQFYEHAWTS